MSGAKSGSAIAHATGPAKRMPAKSQPIYTPPLPPQAGQKALPPVLTLIALVLFLPVELSFYVAGLRLTAARLIFLLISPIVFFKLFNKMISGNYRLVWSDLFFAATSFMMIFAAAKIDGLEEALKHAGPEVLEFLISYLATRTLLTAHGQALAFTGLLCRVIAVIGLIGLLDPLTGQYFTKEIASQLTGYPKLFTQWADAYRLGLLRASGPVEHPILLGFVCAAGLLLSASLPFRGHWFLAAACCIGCLFTFSSAPVQSILLGFGLLAYGKLTAGISFRWTILFVLGALAIASAFVVSNSPLGFIISNLIFDPASGYYRYWTWYTVLAYVSQSPWYGLGHTVLPDEINHTIDALWLMQMIHAGYPGAILTLFAIIGACSISTARPKAHLSSEEERLGTLLGIIAFLTIFVGLTVHFWGSAWIFTGLLAGLRAHLGELGRLPFSEEQKRDASLVH